MAYRILIVDDDIELLKMLKNYFEIKRYDVMMAEDGTDALEKIHKKPDIILAKFRILGKFFTKPVTKLIL